MARLHLGFSALAFLNVPAVLFVLSGALGFEAEINCGTMGWILARTNLAPIILGLIIRGLAPAVADRVAPVAGKAGTIGISVVVLAALVKFYPALLNMDLWSYLIIALVSVAAWRSVTSPALTIRTRGPAWRSSAASATQCSRSRSRPRTLVPSGRCRCWFRACSRSSRLRRCTWPYADEHWRLVQCRQ